MGRCCEKCGAELIQRQDERKIHFKKRRFCGLSCSNSTTQGDKNRARVKAVNPKYQPVINFWLGSPL